MSKKPTNKIRPWPPLIFFQSQGEWHLNGNYVKMKQLKDIMAKLIQSHLKFMLGGGISYWRISMEILPPV